MFLEDLMSEWLIFKKAYDECVKSNEEGSNVKQLFKDLGILVKMIFAGVL